MTDRQIEDRIRSAISSYYAGHPEITDEEYEELISSSGLGWKDVENLKRSSILVNDKIRHLYPMTSLPKVKTLEEVPPSSGHREYQLKLDGSSLEIHYDSRGNFDWAATRGDYEYGDNRTALVRELISLGRIPEHHLPDRSVRGELVVSNASWKSISSEFANQRNASSGISNRKDLQYVRFLSFVAYDTIIDSDGGSVHVDESWGSETYGGGNEVITGDSYIPLRLAPFSTFDEARYAFEHSYYPVDGVVIKDYDESGCETYAVAYKFTDRTYETVIRDVVWQIGKSGKLTPVAEFDPVFIDAEVSRASLGSYQLFCDLDLHYGDRILVRKANMVIPQVVKNVHGGVQKIEPPRFYNGHKTWVVGQHLITQNDDAWRQRLVMQLDDVAGKGIGSAFVDKCIEYYGVKDIYELYRVVNDESFRVPGVGPTTLKRARECLSHIENVDMKTFLSSLHLDGIGEQQSDRIMSKVSALADHDHREQWEIIRHMRYAYEFAFAIDGIGDVIAKRFRDSMPIIREQLTNYAETFHHYPQPYRPAVSTSLSSPSVVLTGKMDVTRSVASEELAANGYQVVNKVTPDVFCVIQCGDRESGKTRDAKKAGVRILVVSDLNDALNRLKSMSEEDR